MDSTTRNDEPSRYRIAARIPKAFIYSDLVEATSNFAEKVGGGGSGSVFKGILKSKALVAVKKVEQAKYGSIFFNSEISTVMSLHNKHIVSMEGFCSHEVDTGGASFIVYEFLANGSLNSWIFPNGAPIIRVLPWKVRYKVAVGVAKALIYIHHDCQTPILHLDVKPANILLDKNFRAVLADFGLATLAKKAGSKIPTNFQGTRGYMAPEIRDPAGYLSAKCDIYSFGAVLIDLFFGRPYVCLDKKGVDIHKKDGNSELEYLAFHAFLREKLEQGDLVQFVDKRLLGKFYSVEANKLVDVALHCLEEDPAKRPRDMRQVLQMLKAGKQNQDAGLLVDKLAQEHRINKASEDSAPSSSGKFCESLLSNEDPNCLALVEFDGKAHPEKSPSFSEVPYETPWHMLEVTLHGAYNLIAEQLEGIYTHLYVEIQFRKEISEARQVMKRGDPQWDEKFKFPMDRVPSEKEEIEVKVLLRCTGRSEEVGICRINAVKENLVDQRYIENREDQRYALNTKKQRVHFESGPPIPDHDNPLPPFRTRTQLRPFPTHNRIPPPSNFVFRPSLVPRFYPAPAPYPCVHLGLQFRFSSGVPPHSWNWGTIVVKVHGARYLDRKDAIKTFAEVALQDKKKKTKDVKENVNPSWEQEFIFDVDERNMGEVIVVSVYNKVSIFTNRLIGKTIDIDVKLAIQRQHSNSWYQLHWGNTESLPEINIEMTWIPKLS